MQQRLEAMLEAGRTVRPPRDGALGWLNARLQMHPVRSL
jgi:hypothetical protein